MRPFVRSAGEYACAVAAVAAFTACGGAGTTAPTAAVAAVFPPGTVITIRSGASDQPVAGATVTVSAQAVSGAMTTSYSTDGNGQVVLDRSLTASSQPLLDISAPGFLARATALRNDGSTSFTLWPSSDASGMDEAFSATTVYSPSSCPAVTTGAAMLRRVSASVDTISIVFGSTLQDSAAAAVHQQAIALLNAATGGLPRYEFTTSPTPGVSFVAEIDPGSWTCTAGPEPLRAATELTFTNGNISGGRLVYCTVAAARSANLVLHELGHTVGLYHSPNTADVMYCSSGRPTMFSAREAITMKLMRQRPTGNRWPDNDRQALAPASAHGIEREIIACGERPQ